MTPFKRRPHLRIAGALADDTTDAEATVDPSSPPSQPPPPRTVQAQESDLVPDVPMPGPVSQGPKYGEMILNGVFVGIGYGIASEIVKLFLGGGKRSSSSGLSGTVHRRRRISGG